MTLPPCTLSAQQVGEDLIGTAGHYHTYVFIECPLPWPAKAFNSQHIPLALRQYVKETQAKRSVRFLCIHRGSASVPARTAVLVYERLNQSALKSSSEDFASEDFAGGYEGREFQVDSLEHVVARLEAHWRGDGTAFQENHQARPIVQQDFFICTHGMRDKCCAQFGQPFFRAAKRGVEQGKLPNSRVWKVSHIGGHRFAPTAVSLPDGRYYGRLTFEALQAIATRSGSISQLRSVYRGWGLLPQPLQVLEQQLLLSHGWQWLDYEVAYKLQGSDEKSQINAELLVHARALPAIPKQHVALDEPSNLDREPALSSSQAVLYRAKIVQDTARTFSVITSCGDTSPSNIFKHSVVDCSVAKYSPI